MPGERVLFHLQRECVCYLTQPPRSSLLPLAGEAEILLDHGEADRVVELAVPVERRESELAVDLVERAEQGPHELHAADGAEQIRDALVGGGIAGAHGDLVVGGLELDVAADRQAVGAAELPRFLDGQGLRKVLHGVEEDELLVAGPALDILGGGGVVLRFRSASAKMKQRFTCYSFRAYLAPPLLGKGVADVDERSVELRLGRQARCVEAALPVDGGDLVFQMSILGLVEKLDEGVTELKGVERLVRPLGEVVGDELVEVFTADGAVQVPDQVETLLVGDGAENIIWVDAGMVNGQLGVGVVLAKLGDGLLYPVLSVEIFLGLLRVVRNPYPGASSR